MKTDMHSWRSPCNAHVAAARGEESFGGEGDGMRFVVQAEWQSGLGSLRPAGASVLLHVAPVLLRARAIIHDAAAPCHCEQC
jgi:hypothetical protein